MDIFKQWLEELAAQIEQAGRIALIEQRILQGCCSECGLKLPANNPSYHCEPDCASHLTDRCKGEENETTPKPEL